MPVGTIATIPDLPLDSSWFNFDHEHCLDSHESEKIVFISPCVVKPPTDNRELLYWTIEWPNTGTWNLGPTKSDNLRLNSGQKKLF